MIPPMIQPRCNAPVFAVIVQGEEAWIKVAVILASIDRSLGIDLDVAMSSTKLAGSTKVSVCQNNSLFTLTQSVMYCICVSFCKDCGKRFLRLGNYTRGAKTMFNKYPECYAE